MNVLLADDHIIITDRLRAMITRLIPDAQITEVTDMVAALVHLKHTETQLVICDINMPGANHFGIVKTIKSIQPHTKLLILSAYNPQLYAHRYLQEGADAYLSKNVPISEIENTIVAVLQGAVDTTSVAEISPLSTLSNRELEVAQLLIEGNGILEIANLLQLRVSTVSTYKTRVFEKMNISNVPALAAVFHNYNK
ncbi:response regulator [Chitinophagaceae bacterium MMS25-I14]